MAYEFDTQRSQLSVKRAAAKTDWRVIGLWDKPLTDLETCPAGSSTPSINCQKRSDASPATFSSESLGISSRARAEEPAEVTPSSPIWIPAPA